MLTASYKKITLQFKRPAGTSRGFLTRKESWLLCILDSKNIERKGIGECSYIHGLSIDNIAHFEQKLQWLCQHINESEKAIRHHLRQFPAIIFGWETAMKDLYGNHHILFPSAFTKSKDPIPINGLIWMGDNDFLQHQIDEKISIGFQCIKLKISELTFENDIQIIQKIRNKYAANKITIRVDANGAFTPYNAIEKLKKLADLNVHSIEQPIAVGQESSMALLCKKSPIDIALDEELIGIFAKEEKEKLLTTIQPQHIVLKPSLLGGWKESEEWIEIAEKLHIGWWITSALESNIGLNAIAQWTYTLKNPLHQGLGTGQLFTNNIASPLRVEGEKLHYDTSLRWENFTQICG